MKIKKPSNIVIIKLLKIFLFLLILIDISLFSIYISSKKNTSEITHEPSTSYIPNSPTKTPKLIPTLISFTNINGELFFKTKSAGGENVFKFIPNYSEPRKIKNLNSDKYQWEDLYETDSPGNAYVFDYKKFPNTDNFIFVIVEDSHINNSMNIISADKTYKAYLFNNNLKTKKLLLKTQKSDNTRSVPRINSISNDGKFVAFDMLQCWACEGGPGEKLLYNLETDMYKRIGITSYFKWRENGEYEYKNSVLCITQPPGPYGCYQNPDNLLLKTGNI